MKFPGIRRESADSFSKRTRTAGIRDATLANDLEEIFERDCKHCVELKLDTWEARGVWHRVKDNSLHAFNELL